MDVDGTQQRDGDGARPADDPARPSRVGDPQAGLSYSTRPARRRARVLVPLVVLASMVVLAAAAAAVVLQLH